ncbi:DUF5996 family protein [Qingshengfaniella alkalisoli]|uniref:Ava_C0101 and related proteins n=1 Tax=Qingshengfaniella alkalisoli TaxID=2599296 RepID=A0A5B8I8L8_9RHOB|nr:DUF5996 family protein [Qingshengfaniella alkalisoli]QDY70375.1 hypothetical protein FPZ52_11630 [Qingshengfaniella alkalisoli]
MTESTYDMTDWPTLPYADWAETCTALHLYAQIVGKMRLSQTPWVNHSWHATLYVTPRGLTTGPIHGAGGCLTLTFDFVDGRLVAEADGGARESFALEPASVARFHERTRAIVEAVGGRFSIHGAPNELPEAVPFMQDTGERPWDADAVRRYHGALLRIVPVFERFRTAFVGKVSPVHLFWGSFDLAVTRFSGRKASLHPGGIPNLPDAVTHEAYDHEVSSAGFWPGNGGAGEPMFYSYAYPVPDDFSDRPVEPDGAYWDDGLGEFLLPYEAVRTSADPAATLMAFLQSSYAAAADTAGWDREALDCGLQKPGVARPVRG